MLMVGAAECLMMDFRSRQSRLVVELDVSNDGDGSIDDEEGDDDEEGNDGDNKDNVSADVDDDT